MRIIRNRKIRGPLRAIDLDAEGNAVIRIAFLYAKVVQVVRFRIVSQSSLVSEATITIGIHIRLVGVALTCIRNISREVVGEGCGFAVTVVIDRYGGVFERLSVDIPEISRSESC